MTALFRFITSSVGSKMLMGITGLGMCLFLLLHMAGNILILAGPEKFNLYGQAMVHNPLLYPAEAGLIVLFLIHVFKGVALSLQNNSARPSKYAVSSNGEKKTSIASKTMVWQGAVIFVFVILHLATFKYGHYYAVTYNGVEMRDLYKLILEVFHEPGYVIWYTIALLILSLHLGHGFYSCFQSMGLNNPKVMTALRQASYVYDAIVIGGFIILPIYVYFLV